MVVRPSDKAMLDLVQSYEQAAMELRVLGYFSLAWPGMFERMLADLHECKSYANQSARKEQDPTCSSETDPSPLKTSPSPLGI